MILYDQDYLTIYKQMSNEYEKVKYYSRKYEREAFKLFEKQKAPCVYYRQITLPDSHNTYLLYYHVLNETERKNGMCFFGSFLLLNDNDGRRIAIRYLRFNERTGKIQGKTESIQIFTGHFFSRYRERCHGLDNLSVIELMATFAGRNLGYMYQLDYDKLVLEKNRQDYGAAWGIDDGITLGESEWIKVSDTKNILVNKHKTFLSKDELKQNQEKNTLSKEEMRSFLLNHYL